MKTNKIISILMWISPIISFIILYLIIAFVKWDLFYIGNESSDFRIAFMFYWFITEIVLLIFLGIVKSNNL